MPSKYSAEIHRDRARDRASASTRSGEFAATGRRAGESAASASPPGRIVTGFASELGKLAEEEYWETSLARGLSIGRRERAVAVSSSDASPTSGALGEKRALLGAALRDDAGTHALRRAPSEDSENSTSDAFDFHVTRARDAREVDAAARVRAHAWSDEGESPHGSPRARSSPIDIPAHAQGKNHWKLCVVVAPRPRFARDRTRDARGDDRPNAFGFFQIRPRRTGARSDSRRLVTD